MPARARAQQGRSRRSSFVSTQESKSRRGFLAIVVLNSIDSGTGIQGWLPRLVCYSGNLECDRSTERVVRMTPTGDLCPGMGPPGSARSRWHALRATAGRAVRARRRADGSAAAGPGAQHAAELDTSSLQLAGLLPAQMQGIRES